MFGAEADAGAFGPSMGTAGPERDAPEHDAEAASNTPTRTLGRAVEYRFMAESW